MRDKRDTRKKRFIATLSAQGTVSNAAQVAGVSRQTAYRWRNEDDEFAILWEEAGETAVDAGESVLYQKALNSDFVGIIFYLKAHRPKYQDRLNVNIEQVQSDIDEMMERFRDNPGLLNPVSSKFSSMFLGAESEIDNAPTEAQKVSAPTERQRYPRRRCRSVFRIGRVLI